MVDSEMDSHLKKCIEICRKDYREVNYRNIVATACNYFSGLFNGDFENPKLGSAWEFLYSDEMWNYLRALPKGYGVRLYSVGLEEILKFGDTVSLRTRKEGIGKLLTTLPKTLKRIRMSAKESAKPIFEFLDFCERDIIGVVLFAGLHHIRRKNDTIVVKYTNSDDEIGVARHLDRLKMSPEIYETGKASIAEEFIRDPKLSQLKLRPKPEDSGRILGNMVGRLHKTAGVVYNNRFWSHVAVGTPIRIIDLETAHFGDDFDTDLQRIESELGELYLGPDFKKAMHNFNLEYNS